KETNSGDWEWKVGRRYIRRYPRINSADEVPGNVERDDHRTDDDQAGQKIIANTSSRVEFLASIVESELGEADFEFSRFVSRQIGQLSTQSMGPSVRMA